MDFADAVSRSFRMAVILTLKDIQKGEDPDLIFAEAVTSYEGL